MRGWRWVEVHCHGSVSARDARLGRAGVQLQYTMGKLLRGALELNKQQKIHTEAALLER